MTFVFRMVFVASQGDSYIWDASICLSHFAFVLFHVDEYTMNDRFVLVSTFHKVRIIDSHSVRAIQLNWKIESNKQKVTGDFLSHMHNSYCIENASSFASCACDREYRCFSMKHALHTLEHWVATHISNIPQWQLSGSHSMITYGCSINIIINEDIRFGRPNFGISLSISCSHFNVALDVSDSEFHAIPASVNMFSVLFLILPAIHQLASGRRMHNEMFICIGFSHIFSTQFFDLFSSQKGRFQ